MMPVRLRSAAPVMNTHERGTASESAVITYLLNKGHAVSIPLGSRRYDLIVDDELGLHRVQVKTGRIVDGCVRFNACSVDGTAKPAKKRYYTRDEVDMFVVFCPQNGKFYRVFLEDGRTDYSLRISPAKNGMKKGIRNAVDYEF